MDSKGLNYLATYKLKTFTFEHICKRDPHVRGLILSLYQQLNVNLDNSPPSYTNKWAQDLERTLEITDWSNIWMANKSSSPNILALDTSYKVLARWYLVPTRIAKYVPSYLGLCFQGCSDLGTHLHVWWQCPIALEEHFCNSLQGPRNQSSFRIGSFKPKASRADLFPVPITSTTYHSGQACYC